MLYSDNTCQFVWLSSCSVCFFFIAKYIVGLHAFYCVAVLAEIVQRDSKFARICTEYFESQIAKGNAMTGKQQEEPHYLACTSCWWTCICIEDLFQSG